MKRPRPPAHDERDDGHWPTEFLQVRDVVAYESRKTMRKLPWFSSLERQDLKQEAWIVAFKAREIYRPDRGATFRTFLLRVVRNRLADILSKEWTQRHLPLVALDEARDVAAPESSEHDPRWAELAVILRLDQEDHRARRAFHMIRLGLGVSPVAEHEELHAVAVGHFALKRRVITVMGAR